VASDRRIAPGIYRTPSGWRLYVRVAGVLKPKRIHDPDHEKGLVELKQLRGDWRTDAGRALDVPPASEPGSFAEDARAKYLPTVKTMADLQERTRHIELWIAEFGDRPRSSIQPWEIAKVRDRWLTEGPVLKCTKGGTWVPVKAPLSASQVNLRLRALENLYTRLDGRRAYNPVREVAEAETPEEEARGLPYDVVERILDAMPTTWIGLKKDGTRTTGQARAHRGLTRLRLRAIAYTGFSHRELMAIRSQDLHLDDPKPWVWIGGRKKGKGTKGIAQPLTALGARALRELAAANGLGAFSRSSMWKSFQRTCRRLKLPGITPYDLRHAFASEVLERTGNLTALQLLMRHRSPKTSARYGQRAIDPVRAAAIEQLRSAGAFGGEKVTPKVTPRRKHRTKPRRS